MSLPASMLPNPNLLQALRDSQRQLRRSDQRQRLLLDNADQGIVVVCEGIVRYHNPAAARLFGETTRAALGRMARDYLHPEDFAEVDRVMRELRDAGAAVALQARIVRPDADPAIDPPRWARISAVRAEWDELPALILYLTDLTDVRNLNQALQDALSQKEAILQNAAVGVCIAEGDIIRWTNEALTRWLGHETEGLNGMALHALFSLNAVLETARRALAQAPGQPLPPMECELRCRDGHTLWVQLDGQHLQRTDGGPPLSFWTFVDISLRRKAELDIRKALEQERELGALKTNFVSMASHEFRTPLTAIQTASDLLLHYGNRLTPDERDDSLRDIQNAVLQMRALMEDVLVLARMDAPATPIAPTRCRVPDLLERLVDESRRVDHGRHPIALAHPMDRREEVAMLDESRMRKILGNLLGNACKYSPPGRPVHVEWRRTVRYMQAGQGDSVLEVAELEIEVRDQGIGIPLKDQPRLFQSFHRASNVGEVEGTGLGLPIVKRAVDSLDGAITVHSVEGQGTVFRVQLPWRDAPGA